MSVLESVTECILKRCTDYQRTQRMIAAVRVNCVGEAARHLLERLTAHLDTLEAPPPERERFP